MRKLPTLTNIDQSELDVLTQLSVLTGAPRAALIRRAIRQYIDREGKQIADALQGVADTNRKSL